MGAGATGASELLDSTVVTGSEILVPESVFPLKVEKTKTKHKIPQRGIEIKSAATEQSIHQTTSNVFTQSFTGRLFRFFSGWC